MTSCKACYAAADGKAGPECPTRIHFPRLYLGYSAGCDLGREDKPPVGPQTSQHALQRPEPVMLGAKPAKLEKDILRQCHNELTRRGVKCCLHLSYRAREAKGWPDLTFAWKGVPCAGECKCKEAGGSLSEDQERVLADMRADGWTTGVWWSLEEFKAFLDAVALEVSMQPNS